MSSTPTPKDLHLIRRYIACVVLGALVAISAIYIFVIESSDKLIAAGNNTAIELKAANAKLSDDLASARSDVSSLTSQRDDRQRVINQINTSVKQLGSGLSSGISTIDDVIRTIQNVIGILQNG